MFTRTISDHTNVIKNQCKQKSSFKNFILSHTVDAFMICSSIPQQVQQSDLHMNNYLQLQWVSGFDGCIHLSQLGLVPLQTRKSHGTSLVVALRAVSVINIWKKRKRNKMFEFTLPLLWRHIITQDFSAIFVHLLDAISVRILTSEKL